MFNSDLLLAFAFMALLFIRQIVILKRPNKINYAPLMIGIGAIASLVHFIIHPETTDAILLVRESIFPLLVALLLYIVMNILHQTQLSENARSQEEFLKVLVSEITQLKAFIVEIEEKMNHAQAQERSSQEEIRSKFKEDIKALDTIQSNQTRFIEKFDAMELWHADVSKAFDYFTAVQLPELDNVVHKHIDILRISEQDHYNKLTKLLQSAVESRVDISDDIDVLKVDIEKIRRVSHEIAQNITQQTLAKMQAVTKSVEVELSRLKSHTEGVDTNLSESEQKLDTIRKQSEIIMNQMVLSTNRMQELQLQNSELHDIYSTLQEIVKDVEVVKSDYVKAQAQLEAISGDLTQGKESQIEEMRKNIEELSISLDKKIDNSLEKLHEHYHIADGEISPSLKMLAKRVQVKSGYGDFES
jgi:chromosome segregation ATPase